MCRPFSGIASRHETYHLDWSDRYEDIIEWFNLPDDPDEIVRYEYSPYNDKYDDLTAYLLTVNQDILPDWWHDRKVEIEAQMAGYVERCIVADRRKILGGGPWILADGAEIDCAVNARIIGMYGSACIKVMRGSAYVGTMCGSACVRAMCDLAHVSTIRELASIKIMRDSACVETMRDSARINIMHDLARVEGMYDSACVGIMYDSARVEAMYDSAYVEDMYGAAAITHDHR